MRVSARFFFFVFYLCLFSGAYSFAQSSSHERAFPQSKDVVEKTLKGLQAATSGRLPTLEGFASAGSRPLERFARAYYRCTVQVRPAASGGSLVRVSAKITAWYNDPAAVRSGYEVIPSSGRLEADLLDQLSDALGGAASVEPAVPAGRKQVPRQPAPIPQIRSDVLWTGRIPNPQPKSASLADDVVATGAVRKLREEAGNLQQILQNQAHPNNLVAVKTSNTAVLASPRLDAKVLFYASVQDEFEILDLNDDWVHVRISGLSRGWIRRSRLEMPDAAPEALSTTSISGGDSTEQFRVTSQETAPFPGNWEPLRGQTVKIISVQEVDRVNNNPRAKLAYAKSLLDKTYPELSRGSPKIAGLLLIFDSEDGGMVAATLASLQQWKTGALSDLALWRQCFFDPPETFGFAASLSPHQ